MSETTKHEFVSPKQYASLFGCSTKTVLRHIESGKLKAHRLGPRIIRIDLAEVLNG
ncbi:helix-turn-helix transcriptional regulator [Arthrobacter sp. CP30]